MTAKIPSEVREPGAPGAPFVACRVGRPASLRDCGLAVRGESITSYAPRFFSTASFPLFLGAHYNNLLDVVSISFFKPDTLICAFFSPSHPRSPDKCQPETQNMRPAEKIRSPAARRGRPRIRKRRAAQA
ncbi:hypothetical protein K8I61_10850 [bacterium]|nr:hypothetical protein [bacterium]